jgi:hypothetical protein
VKVPHPVIAVAWRLAATNRRLRAELDEMKAELSVARCRERRWRKAAHVACEGNPAALRLVQIQADSDDWADAPEIEDRQRNTFPRSLP